MNTKTNKSPLTTVIVLLLAILIGVGGFIAYQLVSKEEQKKQEETGLFTSLEQDQNVVLAGGGKSIKDQLAEMQKEVDEGHVSLSMDVSMSIEEGSKTGKIYLENPVANRYDMFVTLFLDETQSEIGRTGIVPRGNALETMKLEEELAKGEHQATLTYNLIDEEKQVVEQASVGITINVK